MENVRIGVHGDGTYVGGQFNVLSSFNVGLLNALKNKGLNADLVSNFVNQNIAPNLMTGFNVYGFEAWEPLMKHGSYQLMWSVDSIFYQNLAVIKKFHENPNFLAASVTPADNEAAKIFFPNLKYFYLPHGVDCELWKHEQGVKKEHDIIFMCSIRDFEAQLKQVKADLDPTMRKIFCEMYDYTMENNQMTFWQIFCKFAQKYNFDPKNLDVYSYMFNNICYTATHAKRVKLIKELKDYNVKVWGSDLWSKYVEGNAKYMGVANLMESIDIIKRAKIVLHLHPVQIAYGLHERILNATAVGSFVLSDKNPTIMQEFGNTFDYYDNHTFENLIESVDYYLENEEEREVKAHKARLITMENHTWENRVDLMLSYLFGR